MRKVERRVRGRLLPYSSPYANGRFGREEELLTLDANRLLLADYCLLLADYCLVCFPIGNGMDPVE